MNPWMIVLTVVGVAIVLPLVASFLMAVVLESANHEGIYDELDS
jgi:cell division protein FtsX